MSQHATTEPAPPSGRTIGEILLARGFVSAEALEEAVARQQQTGQPLGQILVEAGAITRLELASSLAEQWSEIGSVSADFATGLPGTGGDGTLVEIEELRRTRRALEERMLAFERSAPDADWRAREQRLAERLDALEEELGALRAGDDAVAAQLGALRAGDEAVAAQLRETVVELAERGAATEHQLAALATVVDRVAGQVESADSGVSDVRGRLADLAAAVEKAFLELESRSVDATDALAGLATRLESGPVASLAEHAERLVALERRVAGAAAAEKVEELRAALIELASRPVPDADAHLGVVAAQVEDVAVRVEALASRPDGDPELTARLEELAARVDALASQPAAAGEADGRVAELVVRVEQLAAAVADVAERPHADRGLESRLDDLDRRLGAVVAQVSAPAAVDDALEGRLAELRARVEQLAAALTVLAGRPNADPEAQALLEEIAARVHGLEVERAVAAGHVAELRDTLDEVAARSQPDTWPAERLTELAARVDELAARAPGDDRVVERLDELAVRLSRAEEIDAELRSAVAALAEASPGEASQDAHDERIEALARGAAELERELEQARDTWAAERGALESRLEAVAGQLERSTRAPERDSHAPVVSAPAVAASEDDVERLRMAVERVSLDFAEHRRVVSNALSSREFTALLEELAARVDELQAGGGGVPMVAGETGGGGSAGSRADLRALTRRLDELEKAAKDSREGLFQKLERMMGTVDWRLRRLESPGEDGDHPAG